MIEFSAFSRRFTLIEVVVAALVLMLSVALTMTVFGGARARILRAERRWGREHHLSNMAEFYLLAGASASPGDCHPGLLPQGFDSSCTLEEFEEGLPEHAVGPGPGIWKRWELGLLTVEVYDPDGYRLGERRILKLLKEDDFF